MRIARTPITVFALICLTIGVPLTLWCAESGDNTVLIAVTNAPPYAIEQPNGSWKGFDVEVLEEAFQRAGIRVVIEFYPRTEPCRWRAMASQRRRCCIPNILREKTFC